MAVMRNLLKLCPVIPALLVLAANASAAEETHWLKNDHIEAGFTWKDGIRLSVLRAPGGENLLRESNDPYHGLRTWVMAPTDLEALRGMLSEQPAALEVVDARTIRLRTIELNEWGLRLEWEARIDDTSPELTIRQRIMNEGDTHRYIGVWSIVLFAQGTTFRIPFERSAAVPRGNPNVVAVFPYTNLADARISSTEAQLRLEIREGPETGAVKLGLGEMDGRILVERGGAVLEMTSPYLPDAIYPEGGWNVTVFASPANRPDPAGEAEHMGPLQLLGLKESADLLLTVRLVD